LRSGVTPQAVVCRNRGRVTIPWPETFRGLRRINHPWTYPPAHLCTLAHPYSPNIFCACFAFCDTSQLRGEKSSKQQKMACSQPQSPVLGCKKNTPKRIGSECADQRQGTEVRKRSAGIGRRRWVTPLLLTLHRPRNRHSAVLLSTSVILTGNLPRTRNPGGGQLPLGSG